MVAQPVKYINQIHKSFSTSILKSIEKHVYLATKCLMPHTSTTAKNNIIIHLKIDSI